MSPDDTTGATSDSARADAIVVFARYASKLYPDLDILDEKKYLAEQCNKSTVPLLDRLVKCRAIKKKTVTLLEEILNDMALQRPTFFVDTAKQYYSKTGKRTEEEKQRIRENLDKALEEQRELRKRGHAAPVIGTILKKHGFSDRDIEIISTLQYVDFLKKNPEAAVDVKIKLTGRFSRSYLHDKGIIGKNPARNLVMGVLLGAVIVLLFVIYWPAGHKGPEMTAKNLPKFYMNVIYCVQYYGDFDPELKDLRAQIELTRDCIAKVREDASSTNKDKDEAAKIGKKLDRIEANIGKIKGLEPARLMAMRISEIEKMLQGNMDTPEEKGVVP